MFLASVAMAVLSLGCVLAASPRPNSSVEFPQHSDELTSIAIDMEHFRVQREPMVEFSITGKTVQLLHIGTGAVASLKITGPNTARLEHSKGAIAAIIRNQHYSAPTLPYHSSFNMHCGPSYPQVSAEIPAGRGDIIVLLLPTRDSDTTKARSLADLVEALSTAPFDLEQLQAIVKEYAPSTACMVGQLILGATGVWDSGQ